MGLKERIEQQVRAALQEAAAQDAGRINVARRVNTVVVTNTDGGSAAAWAEQTAPIVQEPPETPRRADD